jgi:Carboxypeptidase regulatory-like domain
MTILNRRPQLLLSVVLVLATPICMSQVTGDSGRDSGALGLPAGKPHSYSGQVVNSVTGQPIARALVQIGGQHAALTDHEGRFEFDNVVEDAGPASASKPGYFPKDNGVIPQGLPITLQLIPEAILFGTINDQTGRPVQDLSVQLKMLQVRNGLRHWQGMQATTTNAEGEFRFAELPAGRYSLATGFKIEGLPEAASSVAFLPLTYPPLAGDGLNGAFTLAPGDHIETNLSPPVGKLYPVTGLVNGRFGQGVGFEIETKDGEPVSPPIRFYPTGAFRLALPSGSYRFKLHSAVERQQFIATHEISVGDAPLQGVSITLEPPATIPIEVEYQAVNTGTQNAPFTPPPFLNVSLQDDDPAGPMRMVSAQPPGSSGEGRAPEPGGPMVFQNVEPGRYAMQAQPQPPWYLASASCGNVDLTREPLVIAAGASACTIRAILRDDSASLKWSVIPGDASDVSNQGSVVAIPLGNLTQFETTVNFFSNQRLTTGSPAEGSLEGLAPGRYLIIALPHPQELPYRDVDALQRYLSLGQEVTLTRNGKSEVQLQLVTGEP